MFMMREEGGNKNLNEYQLVRIHTRTLTHIHTAECTPASPIHRRSPLARAYRSRIGCRAR